MKKILYIIHNYPALSETYIQIEIDALVNLGYSVDVVATKEAVVRSNHYLPYTVLPTAEKIINYAQETKPNIIHTHWVYYFNLRIVYKVAKALNIPYTVRSHSSDVLIYYVVKGLKHHSLKKSIKQYIEKKRVVRMLNDPICKGVLAFPFAIEPMIDARIKNKIVPVPPVINFEQFYDRSKNGTDILNVGSGFRKKNFENYLHLGKLMPEITFHLYPIGHDTPKVIEKNENMDNPITIHTPTPHSQMPSIFKQCTWLVYTADPTDPSAQVGWPLAALEAMASGTGVCLPNIRPDIKEYIGEAGIVYSDINELTDIIDKPVPHEMREKGFELAKKYDIKRQIHLLTELWE